MSIRFRDKNGIERVVSGLTPGGDIEYGAVATRKGTINVPSIGEASQASVAVTFSEPMPDTDYEVNIDEIVASNNVQPYTIGVYSKTVNGFTVMFFNPSSGSAARSMKYTAYKLYTVADAEALYSKVLDMEAMIPSSASSTNKFATADDLKTETKSLDRRLDDVEDAIPSSASITNKLATKEDVEEAMANAGLPVCNEVPSSPEDKDVMLYIGDETGFTKGGIYQYVADPGAWVLISTADVDLSKYETSWTGTKAEWDALSADEKKQYKIANITDDVIGGEVADEVTNGLMSPVTSNAVYDAFASLRTWIDVTSSAVTMTGNTFDRNTIKVYSNGDECIICGEYTDSTNPENTNNGWINGLTHLKVNENYCPQYETALFGFNNRDSHSPVIYYLSTNGKIQGYTGNNTGAGIMDRVPINGRWIINK